ncbi:AMP-binding protein [Streptomyces cirratus]
MVLAERTPWWPEGVRAAVEAEEVTVLHTDPAGALRLLLGDGPRSPGSAARSLRMVTVSGDRLYLDDHAALQGRLRPGARVLALYGTTESAGIGTCFELSRLPAPPADPARLALIGIPFPAVAPTCATGTDPAHSARRRGRDTHRRPRSAPPRRAAGVPRPDPGPGSPATAPPSTPTTSNP